MNKTNEPYINDLMRETEDTKGQFTNVGQVNFDDGVVMEDASKDD
jgi:hypothetical protein